MCEAKDIFQSKEYQESKETLLKTVEGLEAISRTPFFGSWVLNKEKKIVTLSPQICDALFNKTVKQCYDKTMYELFEANNEILKNIFFIIDKYMLDNFKEGEGYPILQFFIKFKDINNNYRFWKVFKYVEPADAKRDQWKYIVSHALFLDIIDGSYSQSLKQLISMKRRKVVKKINEKYDIYVNV